MLVAEGIHRLTSGVVNFYRADVVFPCHGNPWTGRVAEAVRLARAAGRS